MQFIWILFDSSFIALLDQVYSFLSIYTLINSYSFTQHQYPITKSMIVSMIVLSTYLAMCSQIGIIIEYESIRTIPLGHYQIPLLIYSKQPVPNHYLSFPISILFKPSFGYYWWIGIIIICEYLI